MLILVNVLEIWDAKDSFGVGFEYVVSHMLLILIENSCLGKLHRPTLNSSSIKF